MRVPTYESLQVMPSVQSAPRFDAPATPDIAGRQAQEQGHAMMAMSRQLNEIALDGMRTVAKEVDTKATAAFNDALYNPDSGFMSTTGKVTIDAYDGAVDNLRKIRQKSLDEIGDEGTRKFAAEAVDVRLQQALESVNKHSLGQTKVYKLGSSEARAQVSIQDAANNFSDDARFSQGLSIARDEAAAQGKVLGWDDAQIAEKSRGYQDVAVKSRYDAWRVADPYGAFKHFMANQEQVSPGLRDDVGRKLFSAAAPVLADQYNAAGGSGVTTNGLPVDPREPRGIRNFNPGNIIKGSQPWDGEIHGNDPRYATFSSPEAGIRAMGKVLLTYQDNYHLNTVEGIIGRYAPSSENNTGAYVSTVAKALGIKPDTPLNLREGDTLNRLTKAMINVENGKNPYSDEQIATGLAAATTGTPLPKSPASAQGDPNALTGYPSLDQLPADWRLHVLQVARSQASQKTAESREVLRERVQDATASYFANGVSDNAPTQADFVSAYGQGEGVKRYASFQDSARVGQTVQQIRTLPESALADLVITSKPAQGEGFAQRQKNYELLLHSINSVREARNGDPVSYALTSKSYAIQPIKRFDDVNGLQRELARRASAAPQIAADYGTPLQLLAKAEASTLSAMLKAAPVEQQKQYLASMAKSVNDIGLFKSTMQAISPDSPTMAVAGIYQARGLRTSENRDVSDLILRGQAILTPNSKTDGSGHAGGQSLIKMPEEKAMLSDWNSVTGDAFKGKEQASDLFMQTSKAIYAARSAEEGDYSGVINSKRWKQSIMLATGGIESHNGAKVVLPYGYGYDRFQNELKVQAERIVKEGGALNTTAGEMMRLPVENIGDGRYLFRRGAGYLVSKDGRPVVVDLSGGR